MQLDLRKSQQKKYPVPNLEKLHNSKKSKKGK
jgi:hypothetical protein